MEIVTAPSSAAAINHLSALLSSSSAERNNFADSASAPITLTVPVFEVLEVILKLPAFNATALPPAASISIPPFGALISNASAPVPADEIIT